MNDLLKYLFACCCFFYSAENLAQHSASKHHYFNHAHKSRTVTNKKYNDIDDSAFVSSEIMFGNTNSWNGDIYNLRQSVQFLTSYDNNKNFEVGAFVCLTYSSLTGDNPNGIDVFASYRINKKLSVTGDAYTFISKKMYLSDEFGYDSKIYNMYTLRSAYAINSRNTFNIGYSILNDKEQLQQSVFLEFDHNLTSDFTLVLGYATDSKIFDISSSNIYAGIGFSSDTDPKKNNLLKLPVNLAISFNPLFIEQQTTIFPFTILLSVSF